MIVGPGRCCSPRHRMPFNSRNQGYKCVQCRVTRYGGLISRMTMNHVILSVWGWPQNPKYGLKSWGWPPKSSRVWIKTFLGYWLILILNLLPSIDVDSVNFFLDLIDIDLIKSDNQSIGNRLSPSLKSTDICPKSELKSSQTAQHCPKWPNRV